MENLQSAAIGLGEMAFLIIAIALGVLVGTLVISPHKFVPLAERSGSFKVQEV